jgi:hypothetical protein
MKLFLLSRIDDGGWDTYDSAVVAAPDEETARNMNPANGDPMDWGSRRHNSWCAAPELVEVSYLGEAVETQQQDIICASFNAG